MKIVRSLKDVDKLNEFDPYLIDIGINWLYPQKIKNSDLLIVANIEKAIEEKFTKSQEKQPVKEDSQYKGGFIDSLRQIIKRIFNKQ